MRSSLFSSQEWSNTDTPKRQRAWQRRADRDFQMRAAERYSILERSRRELIDALEEFVGQEAAVQIAAEKQKRRPSPTKQQFTAFLRRLGIDARRLERLEEAGFKKLASAMAAGSNRASARPPAPPPSVVTTCRTFTAPFSDRVARRSASTEGELGFSELTSHGFAEPQTGIIGSSGNLFDFHASDADVGTFEHYTALVMSYFTFMSGRISADVNLTFLDSFHRLDRRRQLGIASSHVTHRSRLVLKIANTGEEISQEIDSFEQSGASTQLWEIDTHPANSTASVRLVTAGSFGRAETLKIEIGCLNNLDVVADDVVIDTEMNVRLRLDSIRICQVS
jgi:hypothetical protein